MIWPFKKQQEPDIQDLHRRAQAESQLRGEEMLQKNMEQAIHRVGHCLKQESPAAAFHAISSGGFSRGVTQKMANAADRQREGDAYGATGSLQEAGEMAINEYRASVIRARELREELEDM
tara:strand:+ start:1026 stop:1385 length:360 start_codon:yes stop_codon:yes gene_type:complete